MYRFWRGHREAQESRGSEGEAVRWLLVLGATGWHCIRNQVWTGHNF